MRHRNILAGLSLLAIIGLSNISNPTYAAESTDPYQLPIDNVVVIVAEGSYYPNINIIDAKFENDNLIVTVELYFSPRTIPNNPVVSRSASVTVTLGFTGGPVNGITPDESISQSWPTGELPPPGQWGRRTFIFPNVVTQAQAMGLILIPVAMRIEANTEQSWEDRPRPRVYIDSDVLIVSLPDPYIKVTPTPVEVITGGTQNFKARAYLKGLDRIKGTPDDIGPFLIAAGWSIEQGIGNIIGSWGAIPPLSEPAVGPSATFTAVKELPQGKDKLTGSVIAAMLRIPFRYKGKRTIQGRAEVTVIGREEIDHIKISPNPAYVPLDGAQQFIARGYDNGRFVRNVKAVWTTSVLPTVGSIDKNTGFFRAGKEAGKGTITATYGGLTNTAEVIVFGVEITDDTIILPIIPGDDKLTLGYERWRVFYKISPTGFTADLAKLEIKDKDNTLVYKADNIGKSGGTHHHEWHGKWNQPPHSGRYVNPQNSPYTVKITIFKAGVKHESNTKHVKVEAKAFAGTPLMWQLHPRHIARSIRAMGYTVLRAGWPLLTERRVLRAAPRRLVWYTFSHGGFDRDGIFRAVMFGAFPGRATPLYPEELPAGLNYTLVFLNACGSAQEGSNATAFADAFGADAYIGWKGSFEGPFMLGFALPFFRELDGNHTVQEAKIAAIERFEEDTLARIIMEGNVRILRGHNVIIDLSPYTDLSP